MIKFSVIIPNYNHAEFLKERIDSVIAQAYSTLEIIILDDCSTDNSRQIIENYRNHPAITQIIYNEVNIGSPFKQWKKGIELAAGDWIWIAESDDSCSPSFLSTAAEAIIQNMSLGFFYSDSRIIEKGNDERQYSLLKNIFFQTSHWTESYSRKGIDEVNDFLKYNCTINNASAVVFSKNKILPALERISEFQYYGDWYAYLYLATQSDIYYCNQPLSNYSLHKKSLLQGSLSKLQQKKEYFQILDFLYQQANIKEKNKIISSFVKQYLNFAILKDGIRFGKKLFHIFRSINPDLSQKVFTNFLLQKITNRKHKQHF